VALYLMIKFDAFSKDIRKLDNSIIKLLVKAELHAVKAGNHKLAQLLRKDMHRLSDNFATLHNLSKELSPLFQKELEKKTNRLEKKIAILTKARENLISNNYLLEYKKKDLLLMTNKLEEAYEEITIKNNELLQHQEKISDQTEKLNAIHEKILEKNRELEQQKEGLLDQSDYLHDANQTITMMHEEVQKQKTEIEKKNDELLILNNEKNNLISIVAHDLKSPLNQIKGMLSIMKMEGKNFDGESLNYIAMMEHSAGRLTDMIAKILDVEAIESKVLNIVFEVLDLSEILQQIVNRFTVVAAQKSITIHSNIEPNLCVSIDRTYIDQVFENLLSNAVKFSPRNKSVLVNLNQVNGNALAEIKDEGPGLTEDDKRKLFGKYQKLSAKPTGNEISTGLGLSIVKKFIDTMHGEIWCESEAGRGASFFVSFRRLNIEC
jgi:signal transduction histidine kinase